MSDGDWRNGEISSVGHWQLLYIQIVIVEMTPPCPYSEGFRLEYYPISVSFTEVFPEISGSWGGETAVSCEVTQCSLTDVPTVSETHTVSIFTRKQGVISENIAVLHLRWRSWYWQTMLSLKTGQDHFPSQHLSLDIYDHQHIPFGRYTASLTKELTSWSRALHESLMVAQLIKNISDAYGIWRFTTGFTRPLRHVLNNRMQPIVSHAIPLISILLD
jgi:hypothetical protein